MNSYTRDSLLADYTRGMTIIEIARQHALSYRAIWQAMVRFGIPRRSKASRDQRGERNPHWGGVDIGYFGCHKRVRKIRGVPQRCETCHTTKRGRYEWANLTGRYEDPNDYIRLCKSCHTKLDGLIGNLQGNPPPRRTP